MITRALLLAVGFALAGGAGGAWADSDSLTIVDCARLAARHAPAVLAARATHASAAADSAIASVNGHPAFDLEGGATVAPRGFYDPAMTNLGEYRAQLAGTGPILDGGELYRARVEASLGAQSAGVDEAQAARDAGRRAIELATGLLESAVRVRDLEDEVAWLSDFSTVVDAGVRAGRRGRADAVRVDLERDQARASLLTAQGERGPATRELNELIGRPYDSSLALATPDADVEAIPSPADSAAALARAARSPAVRAIELDALKADLALDSARHLGALNVTWLANVGFWGSDLTRLVPPDVEASNPGATVIDRLKRDFGAEVGLEFKKPLRNPAKMAVIEARIVARDAQGLRRAGAVSAQEREALDLLEHWRTAAAQLALARASTRDAEENALRLRSLYAGGAAGVLDVMDARTQLEDARVRLLAARLELWRARFTAEAP